jgi:hypothetical protein
MPTASEVVQEDPPQEATPQPTAETANASPRERRSTPRAGKNPRRTGIVAPSSGNPGTKACTPESFDYPACLKSR